MRSPSQKGEALAEVGAAPFVACRSAVGAAQQREAGDGGRSDDKRRRRGGDIAWQPSKSIEHAELVRLQQHESVQPCARITNRLRDPALSGIDKYWTLRR